MKTAAVLLIGLGYLAYASYLLTRDSFLPDDLLPEGGGLFDQEPFMTIRDTGIPKVLHIAEIGRFVVSYKGPLE
jgi:hypothetical protein